MTIDTIYAPKTSAINAQQTYSFTYESTGADSIYVSYLDAEGNSYSVATSDYVLTLYGESPIYDGGQVVITTPAPSGMVEVQISRLTPRTQLVDYQPYTAFPAETQEFALDKLTMIAQETEAGESGGGTPVDPNSYVPITGTRVGVPMTGTIESASNNQNYRLGIIGAGFDGYFLTDQKQDGNAKFVVAINQKLSAFDSEGQLLLSTVYDGNEDPSAAATVQYVLDAVGGPGAAFIPMTGTSFETGDVTGEISFENTTLGVDGTIGILEGITNAMSLYSNGDIVIATGATVESQWFGFGENGQLNLPDIDYSLVDDLDAVNKAYVDAAVAGGGSTNTFIPLAGTDPSFPITGNLDFVNVANNREFIMGLTTLPGFEEGFVISSAGSSGDPSNIWLIASGTIYEFSPTQLTAEQIAVTDLFATNIVTGGIIANGGAQFGADVNITSGDLNVQAGELTAMGGLVTSSIVGNGIFIDGGGQIDSLSLNNAPTNATQATRKDYVDGLNATNVKTTGNQTISGTKTFGSNILTNGINVTGGSTLGIVQAALGGSTKYIKCNSAGGFFSSTTLAAADVAFDVGPNLAGVIDDLKSQLTAAQTKLNNMRAALDGMADIDNWSAAKKAQLTTLLNSLGIV